MLKIAAQTEVVECIAAPKIHGFQKRCALFWCPDHTPQDETQDAAKSEELIQELHDFAFTHFSSVEGCEDRLDRI